MLARLRGLADSARGLTMLAFSVARYARLITINTGKRLFSPMTAPAPASILNAAVEALFGAAIKIKRSLDPDSPGGSSITLNELLDTVSDGAVRESIQAVWDSIHSLVRGERVDVFDLITKVANALLDLLGTLRDALADGRITPDEILHGITDGGIRTDLKVVLDNIGKLPAELQGLDMWKMIALFQRISAFLPQLMVKS